MGRRTPIGSIIHSTWTNLNIRCSNGKYHHMRTVRKCKGYSNTEILFTRDEFKKYCLEHKDEILMLDRASIDRKDVDGGYSIDNIQFIELADNIRKDKLKAKDGMCECYVCKETKPIEMFSKDKRRFNGRTTLCKKCDSKRRWSPKSSTGRV